MLQLKRRLHKFLIGSSKFFILFITEVLTKKMSQILKITTTPAVPHNAPDDAQGFPSVQPTGKQAVDVSVSVGNAVDKVNKT